MTQFENAAKEGQVKTEFDKEVGKNVIVITGVTSPSNYIQVPKSKKPGRESLGIMAKYVSAIAFFHLSFDISLDLAPMPIESLSEIKAPIRFKPSEESEGD